MHEFPLTEPPTDPSRAAAQAEPPRRKNRRLLWLGLGLLAILGLGAAGFAWKRNASQDPPHLVVKRQDLKDRIDVSGAVFSERDVVLKASVSAQVLGRLSVENQRVALGTPLLRLDAATYGLQLQQARTNAVASAAQAQTELQTAQKALEDALKRKSLNQQTLTNQERKAQQNLDFQEAEYLRQVRLAAEGAVPAQRLEQQKQTLDQARLDLKVAFDNGQTQLRDQTEISTARSRIKQAQTALANAQNQGTASIRLAQDSLSKSAVLAPFSGTVARWQVNRGDYVTPGTPLARFLDTQDLRLTLNVNELDLPRVKIGSQVEIIFDAFPDSPYPGKITWISESSITDSENVQVFPVKVGFANPQGKIRPGMSADARITASERKAVLALPISSVQKKEGQFYADILINGQAQPRKIKLGLSTLESVEVLSGLQAGDKVLLEPQASATPVGKR